MRTFLILLTSLLFIIGCKKEESRPELPNSKFSLEYLSNGMVKASVDGIRNSANIYSWTFGDGSSYHGTDVAHTYKQNGTFNVSLVVTGPNGQSTTSRSALINNIPTVGDITFYLTKNGYGPVEVSLNSVHIGRISVYYNNNKPVCGETGNAFTTRSAGTYNFTAKSVNGLHTWSGTVQIINGQCSLMGLN